MYQDFLPLVTKPARYIDNEVNAVRKDLAAVRTKVCLFFPDTYEVGMSHLGLRVLYHVLNGRADTACERVFSPWTDYEERLRSSGGTLASLESGLPLSRFDIIGVTLQYELSYTNVLAGLLLAGIPARAADRNDSHPVIIAGGPCAVNPAPLSDYIDVFFIGEAEEAVHDIVELRQRHASRRDYLEALSRQEGFFVPMLGASAVRRRRLGSLETAPWPDRPLLPLLKPVHDRVAVEIARGCIRGCRFCQAGIIYRPYRERSGETVKRILDESLRCTGYDELSLASLSAGDHSGIRRLVPELMAKYTNERVSVSLPSLRVGTLTPEMIEAIASTRRTGFTLAPEAGTERLRRVINKPVSDQDLVDAAETIFKNGWSVMKLYFMLGLPTETDQDLDGIIVLCRELLAVGKKVSKRHIQLNVSVSTFVPKPHTPFQWFGQAPIEEVRRKQAHLARGLTRRGINLKPHRAEMSLLEAAFARGDGRLGKVLGEAVDLGCRFDGWTERFDPGTWAEAFRRSGMDAAEFAGRAYRIGDPLPWDHIRCGVTGEFLRREYERAMAAEVTPDCRDACERCGIGCADGGTEGFGRPAPVTTTTAADRARPPARGAEASGLTARIRLRYARTGKVRFLSHLDFMTLFQRTAARAGIPLAFSQGFNPHPKIAFGPALPVGMESEAEYLDMETDPFIDLLETVKELNRSLPEGVRVLEARTVPRKAPSLSGSIAKHAYELRVPADLADGLDGLIGALLGKSEVPVLRDGKRKDIRPGIVSVRRTGGDAVEIVLRDSDQARPRVQDVIEQLFGISREQALLVPVRRTSQEWNDRGTWVSPMEVRE